MVIGVDLLTAPLLPPVWVQRLRARVGAADELDHFDPAALLAVKEAATKVIGGRVRDTSLLDITVTPMAAAEPASRSDQPGLDQPGLDQPGFDQVEAVLATIADDLGVADADQQVIGWSFRAPNDEVARLAGAGPRSGPGVVARMGDLTLALCLGWREETAWV